MTKYEQYSLIVEAVVALATVLAVIMAIWGEKIRQKLWASPKLEVSLKEPAFTTTHGRLDGWYYLIRLANKRQSIPALNVRLLLKNVYKKGPSGAWQEHKFSGPSQVLWRWPAQSPQYMTVGPEEVATFGVIQNGKDYFKIQLYHTPKNLNPLICKNEPTRLVFQAVSDTAQSNLLAIEVAWDGIFNAGALEMANHCVVREVSLGT